MSDDQDELSRRELLKKTGAALSALAVGGACGADEAPPDNAAIAGQGGSASGVAGTAARGGSGVLAGSGGTAPSGGSGGTQPVQGGSGGNPSGAGTGGMAQAGRGDTGGRGGNSGAGGGANPGGRVRVAIVRRSDLDQAIARAVELAGGIDEIKPGQSVFIKPNIVSDRARGTPGIRTSNEVIAAVVRLVKQRNPGRIIVGDRAARSFPNSTQVFQNVGLPAAAMAAGADEVYAAPPGTGMDAWTRLQPPGYEMTWQAAGGILAMRKILEADHLINVPTCKNHRYALYSLSMKNFIGAIADSSRDPLHYGDSAARNFEPLCRDIAIMNQIFKPLINIIDATTALINGGPQGDGSDAVRTSPGLILASRDRIAIDALGVSLIKRELGRTQVPTPDAAHSLLMTRSPWQLPQSEHGRMRGIGVAGAAEVDLMFDDVPDAAAIEMIFRS